MAFEIINGQKYFTTDSLLDFFEGHTLVSFLHNIGDPEGWARTVNGTPGVHVSEDCVEAIKRGRLWLATQAEVEAEQERRAAFRETGVRWAGTRDHGDSKVLWWVLDRDQVDHLLDRRVTGLDTDAGEEAILELLARRWNVWGTSWTSPYDCTGRWFAGQASIEAVSPSRILVVQSWALDV